MAAETMAITTAAPVQMQTRSATEYSLQDIQFAARAAAASVFLNKRIGANSPADAEATAFLLMVKAKDLGLPISSVNNMHMIQGQAVLSTHQSWALVMNSGVVNVKVEEGDGWCAVTLTRRDNGFSYTSRWDVERAKATKLLGKDIWQAYQPNMLRARAKSEATLMVCPEVTQGVYTPADFGYTDEQLERGEHIPRVVDADEADTPLGKEAKALIISRLNDALASGVDADKLKADVRTIQNADKRGEATPGYDVLDRAKVRAILRVIEKAMASIPEADVQDGVFDTAPGTVSRLQVNGPDAARWPRGEDTPVTWWRQACSEAGLGDVEQRALQASAFGEERPPDSPDEMGRLLVETDKVLDATGTFSHATDVAENLFAGGAQ